MKLLKNVVFVVFLMLSGICQAESPCDQVIVDPQGYIKDLNLVNRALEELGQQGAEVRIRVVDYAPPNLDDYVTNVIKTECTSWQRSDGDLRSNFIVLYVATKDPQLGQYMGVQWERELEKEWSRIIGALKSKFRGGLENEDFSLAFASWMKEITATIRSTYRQPTTTQPVVVQTEPADFSGLWKVLLTLVVGAFLAAFLVFGLKQLAEHKREKEKRKEIQQKAKIARGQCSALIREIHEALPVAGAEVNIASNLFDAETANSWRKNISEISSMLERSTASFASVRGNPDDEGKSAGEYAAIFEYYAALEEELDRTNEDLISLRQELSEAQEVQKTIPVSDSEAVRALDELKVVIKNISAQGFVVPESLLKQVQQVSDDTGAARNLVMMKNIYKAEGVYKKAIQLATEVAGKIESLPQLKQSLETRLSEEQGRVPQVLSKIEEGYTVFLELERTVAPSCIESIVGNGTQAQKHLRVAEEKLPIVAQYIKEQSWDAAGTVLDEVDAHLDEAESLIHSITERDKHLKVAKEIASREIEDAYTDVVNARVFLTTHDDDTDDVHFRTLDEAEELLKEAKLLLAVDKPDYIRVVRLATSANSTADKAFEKAQDEFAYAERKRHQAKTLLQEAASSISAASEYFEDHHADISHGARERLSRAEKAYREAESCRVYGDVDGVIHAARKADGHADTALEIAKLDFKRKEDEREEEREEDLRRSRRSTGPVIITDTSPWGSSDNSSPGSFGGSISFGSGDGKSFGGSTSF